MKKGILLVAFGSSRQEAHLSLRSFDERVARRFDSLPTRWAFTSGIVRGKLADKGKKTDSVVKALEKMRFEQYTHVAVQSLHVITGAEYYGLAEDVANLQGAENGLTNITLGRPLISDNNDIERAVDAIMAHLPQKRQPGDPVVLMGHGTWHEGDSHYDALFEAVQARDPNVYLATMDGRLTIGPICETLAAQGVSRAWLMPLLAVPGRHVHKDMCGNGPDSWVNILESAGIACSCVTTGTAEYDAFADIWLDHLAEALDAL